MARRWATVNFPSETVWLKRVLRRSALVLLSAWPGVLAAADYRPPDQRTVYDDWMRDSRDKQAAKDRANAYKPGESNPRD